MGCGEEFGAKLVSAYRERFAKDHVRGEAQGEDEFKE